MSDGRRPCHLIQEDIAWARGLRPEDRQHVLSCDACSGAAARLEELDSLVRDTLGVDVPDGFAEGVISRIETEEPGGARLPERGLTFLERIFFSKAVQWALVGIGSAFGLFKIFRFFAGVLAHAPM